MGRSIPQNVASPAVISGIPQEEYQPNEGGSVIIIQPTLPATGIGDMIIRTAELKLEVENGKGTYKKISEICQELGGYLAESNFFRDEEGREYGAVTLRIPKDKFLAALDKLDGLGKVKDSNTASQDVSQEYANLKSQLEAAKVVYDKMLEALKKRQATIPEAIKLESELTPVLRRIEYFKNQVERLNNLTSFTTITVHFYESEVSAKVLEETKHLIKKEMLAAKIKAVRWLAQNLLFVGFGILLGVAVIAAILSLASWVARSIKRG
jgi:dsDNA-binding SOS-regulon protein